MRRVTLMAMAALLLAPGLALAQPTTPVPVPPTDWYASVAGIVAATVFAVSLLKRLLANVQGLNAVPTWLYAVVVSAAATWACVSLWKTMPGPYWQLAAQAVAQAAAASGFYEWWSNSSKPLAASAVSAGVAVRPDRMPARPL